MYIAITTISISITITTMTTTPIVIITITIHTNTLSTNQSSVQTHYRHSVCTGLGQQQRATIMVKMEEEISRQASPLCPTFDAFLAVKPLNELAQGWCGMLVGHLHSFEHVGGVGHRGAYCPGKTAGHEHLERVRFRISKWSR